MQLVCSPEVRCVVSDGFFPNFVSAQVQDRDGRPEFLLIYKTMIRQLDGVFYLPVGIIAIDEDSESVLVQFPTEADSGSHRSWMTYDSFRPLRTIERRRTIRFDRET